MVCGSVERSFANASVIAYVVCAEQVTAGHGGSHGKVDVTLLLPQRQRW